MKPNLVFGHHKESFMSTIKKILLPVDFLKSNEEIAEYALFWAKAYGAEITVFHVLPPLSRYYHLGATSGFAVEVEGESQRLMDEFIAEMFTDPSVKVNSEIAQGDAAKAIVAYAEENEIDLIIMTTYQRTDLGAFFIGSVTNKVVKSAIPLVLTLRPAEKT